MRYFVLLLAALAACSSDPSPTPGPDAQADAVTDVANELAPDAAADVVGDTGPALDAAVDAAPDVVTDATPEAAADVADAAVGDASPSADVDGGAGDAAVVADAADGAVTYDLNRPYDAIEFRALYTATCVPGECANAVVESVTGAMDCYVASGEMHFTVGPIVGLVYLGRDAGMGSGVVNYGSLATVAPVLTAGRTYMATGPRQNFRVQFAVTATHLRPGATGVPGRTANPDMGEVWAFGCPVR
jgi:hypothetical protein